VQENGIDERGRRESGEGLEGSAALGEISGVEKSGIDKSGQWAQHRSGLEPRSYHGDFFCTTCKQHHNVSGEHL
jgi:hypothetical protein